MPYSEPLDDAALAAALEGLDGWERDAGAIRRTVRCRGFRAAIALVNQVADAADAANHHPDIAVTNYREVTFALTTHAAGGITRRDTDLAAEIDAAVARIGAA